MYGENLGTGTLKGMLVRIAQAIAEDRTYFGDTVAEDCRYLMEGATVLWHEMKDEEQPVCRASMTVLYDGTPYARYEFECGQTGEDYAMKWVPRHCPECGGLLVITDEEVCDG